MFRMRIPYQQAHALVLAARPIIRPNPGFTEQLEEFEFELKAGAADWWCRKHGHYTVVRFFNLDGSPTCKVLGLVGNQNRKAGYRHGGAGRCR